MTRLRKLGDSNPRYGYPYVSLANWWFQPLTQTSFFSEALSLKRGAKIGIIFNTANIWRNILLKSALFFILLNSYIVLLEELSGVFDEDIQMVTCSFREL